MKINYKKKEIILTKEENTKAMKVGSQEYKDLVEVRKDFPDFKVVTAKRKNSKQDYKRLTTKFMLKYISENHADYLDEFTALVKSIGKATDDCARVSFFEVRKVFLNRYPQFMTEADRKKYEDELSAASATNTITMQPAASDPLSAKSA